MNKNIEENFEMITQVTELGLSMLNKGPEFQIMAFKDDYNSKGTMNYADDSDKRALINGIKKAATELKLDAIAGAFTIQSYERQGKDVDMESAKEELLGKLKKLAESGELNREALESLGVEDITIVFLWDKSGEIKSTCLKLVSKVDEDGDILKVPERCHLNDKEENTIKATKALFGEELFDGKYDASAAIVFEK